MKERQPSVRLVRKNNGSFMLLRATLKTNEHRTMNGTPPPPPPIRVLPPTQITGVMDECLAISSASPAEEVSAKFSDAGLAGADTRAGYGFTKAVVNMYNMYLAREHPNLLINSCTPGWIVTDLSRAFVGAGSGKTVEEMGGKPPSDGAKTPIFLATGDVPGSGWYFGSDGLRSPLDRYRNPGDPAYDGK